MERAYRYLIVGGGTAGAHAVEGIRAHDPNGSIALFGAERHIPYDRPPLSKGLWLGKVKRDEMPVFPRSFYESNGVALYLGAPVESVNTRSQTVTDHDGREFRYERLLIASGGVPRTLDPGKGIVRYYRTIDDYDLLAEASGRGQTFVLIGGGFIGAELAAALTLQGKDVSLLFPGELLLERVLPRDLASFVTNYYRSRGVHILEGDLPTGVGGSPESCTVSTMSGRSLKADGAVAAIGLALNTGIAAAAGLSISDGIDVNAMLQTSDPMVYAAGDVASFPSVALGRRTRIEHWDNARAQGRHAGENMAGAGLPFEYIPYFYSDLFDLGFEAVGDLDARYQTFADWREEFREGVVYYLKGGLVQGVLLWNVWERVDAARQLISARNTYANPEDLRGTI